MNDVDTYETKMSKHFKTFWDPTTIVATAIFSDESCMGFTLDMLGKISEGFTGVSSKSSLRRPSNTVDT